MALTDEIRAGFLKSLGPTYASAYPQGLEQQFPHIFEKLVGLWGTNDMEPYFDSLLVTKRSGRAGFPTEVADELLRLFSIYHKLGLARRPAPQVGDVWNWVDHVGYFDKKADIGNR